VNYSTLKTTIQRVITTLLVYKRSVQARAIDKCKVGPKGYWDQRKGITELTERFTNISKSAQEALQVWFDSNTKVASEAVQLPANLVKILANRQAVQGVFSTAEAEAIFVPSRVLLPAIKKAFDGLIPKLLLDLGWRSQLIAKYILSKLIPLCNNSIYHKYKSPPSAWIFPKKKISNYRPYTIP
jgi:hypothetical protein